MAYSMEAALIHIFQGMVSEVAPIPDLEQRIQVYHGWPVG